MVCERIGYYGACMDGFTAQDILFVGLIMVGSVLFIKLIIYLLNRKKDAKGEGSKE